MSIWIIMSWQKILPKIAVILPLTFFLNMAFFESLYITSVIILFFLVKIIGRVQLIFDTKIGAGLVLLILAFLFVQPFVSFILAVALHAMIIASILGKL